MYLDRTLAQQLGSAKVLSQKAKSPTVFRFPFVSSLKQDVVACAFVFVSDFLEYVSAENWQTGMTSD